MNTLALETSVQPGSIALLRENVTIYQTTFPLNQKTTQSFAVQIQSALAEASLTAEQIDLFTVCQGPGSFTGLRIGVTAAKTFAYAANCQVLGIDSLEVIAHQAPATGELKVVMDAQRKQLFQATFRCSENHLSRLSETTIEDADVWLANLTETDQVTGPGLNTLQSRLPATTRVIDSACWAPTALALAKIANQQFAAGKRQDFWKLVPLYYRKSAAEEKVEKPE